MKKTVIIISSIILLASCSSTKQLTTLENSMKTNYSNKNYETVIEDYEKLTTLASKKKQELPAQYTIFAGKSFYNIEKYSESLNLLSSIKDKDEEAIFMEGMSYYHLKNNNEEFSFWNANRNSIKNAENEQIVLNRIYDLAINFADFQLANRVWTELSNNSEIEQMEKQVTVLDNLGEQNQALSLANNILKKDANNEEALFYRGTYYFNKAESLYQSEMAKYNKNPNYTAYAYLRRELKKASSDFRNARDIFERLYKIAPDNKKYIAYLKNSYLRLEMRNEAAKMDKLLNN